MIDADSCILGNLTLINGGSRIEISSIGTVNSTSVFNEYKEHGTYNILTRFVLEIAENLSGRLTGNVFRLGLDITNNVFYLISEDTGLPVLPAQLTATTYPKTCTGTATLWELHANMGFEGASLKNVLVSEEIYGSVGNPARGRLVQSGLVQRKEASDVMDHEDSAIIMSSLGRGVVSQVVSAATFGGYAGNRRMYSDGFIILTATVSSGNPIEVKAWKADGALIGTITTSANATSNDVGYISCIKNKMATYVAVPVGRRVEYFYIDTINSRILSLGFTNYGDGTSDEARVSIPITEDRFWIGGSYSTSTIVHNLELHSLATGTVVQRYRVGKTNLASIFGNGLATNGRNLVALAIHSMVANTSIVECLNINADGSIPSPSVGSYMWTGTTFYKNDWNNDLTVPLKVAMTSKDILVYGTNGGLQVVVDRYPVHTSTALLDTTPASINFVPTVSKDIVVDINLTINAFVFASSDDDELVMLGRDAPITPGTQEYSVAYIMEPKTLDVNWGGLYSAVTYDKLNVVAAACCDGASIYFLDDPTSSGQASIKRMDVIEGQRVAFRPSRSSSMKRSVIYGK